MTKVIGLTGGIATGKSTVSKMFKNHGTPVIDADHIAKSLLVRGSEAYKELVEQFGEKILATDNSINRNTLAKMIFNNETIRKQVNAIIHPRVIRIINTEIEHYKNLNADAIVVDVPLLFESGFYKQMDVTVLVYARQKDQIERLVIRDKIDIDYAKQKIKAQFSLSKKREMADHVIDNSKSILDTKKAFQRLMKKLELE